MSVLLQLVVLSDRLTEEEMDVKSPPIPTLLAVGSVHHHLVRCDLGFCSISNCMLPASLLHGRLNDAVIKNGRGQGLLAECDWQTTPVQGPDELCNYTANLRKDDNRPIHLLPGGWL